ncbi:hypothetical protein BerOc1_02891 [Pseudodesulfovibrio hydrargyri]|uniref:Uncharacterized protein n=1 Tax=Pseudodesulfovibrio hydrargyri TaxID=2125990 RepID=A0A1J5MY66_9BACT|nr:hypothetical protein [Pseudodesulfovibrio hydrargyri]OIQ50946.1 hypothetical protein BerOc1_02891 [Pseudodesulfovibrio hydrargyri]
MLAFIEKFLQNVLPGLSVSHRSILLLLLLCLVGTSPLAAVAFPELAAAIPQLIGPWPNFAASVVLTFYFMFLVKDTTSAAGPGGRAGDAIFSVGKAAGCLTVNADLRELGEVFVESFTYDDSRKKWMSYEMFRMDYRNNQYKADASAIRSHLKNEGDPFKPFLLVDGNDEATLGRAYYALFNIADVIVTERGDANRSATGEDSTGWRIYFLAKNQFPLHPVQGDFASLNHTLLASAGLVG